MPKLRLPKLCHHKGTGQAYVLLNGKRKYLGKFGSKSAERAYEEVTSKIVAQHRGGSDSHVSIAALSIAFLGWAEKHYRKPDGTQTGEVNAYRCVLKQLVKHYGKEHTADFGPLKLLKLRDEFAKVNARTTANKKVFRVRKVFRWGVSRELVPGAVIVRLDAVEGLQAGRSIAKEAEPVLPVPSGHIDAVLPFVTSPVATMIKLQLRTGARPSEVLQMQMRELDMSGDVWVFRPTQHKNLWRGKTRTILIGKIGQTLLLPYVVSRKPDEYLFRPADGRREFVEQKYRSEASVAVRNAGSENKPYTLHGYTSSIRRACQKAKVPIWSPGRLRHNAATLINERYGDIDAARTVLGHTAKNTTEIYAERDLKRAAEIMLEIG